jgi:hypothetical protein
MSEKTEQNKEVHMSSDPREHGWVNKNKEVIPFEKMSNTHLQRAKMWAQLQQLRHFNRMNKLTDVIEKLEKEAERRGIKLKDYNTKYHRNERKLKNAANDGRQ